MAQDGTKCRQIAFHATSATGIVDGDVQTITISGPHLVQSQEAEHVCEAIILQFDDARQTLTIFVIF